MKRKLLLILTLCIITICSAFGLAACNVKNPPNDETDNKKHTHVYDKEVAESKYLKFAENCFEKAQYYFSCECGEKGTDTFEYGNVLPHSFTQEKAETKYLKTEATCTSKAVYYNSCSVCGEIGTETFESGEKLAHRFTNYYSSPLCSESGTYFFTYCKDCGHIENSSYDGGIIHPHDYELIPEQVATCTSEGIITGFKCKNCGHIEQLLNSPRLGHRFNNTYYDYDNSRHYRICTRSGCEHKEYSYHKRKSGTYTVLKQKTCTQSGEAKYICKDCNAEVTVILSAGHIFDYENGDVLKAATCIEAGLIKYSCKNCTETMKQNIKELEHYWNNGMVVKEPNCHNKGEIEYECRRCGEKHSENLDEKHSYGEWVVTEQNTCTKNGLKVRTCTLCGNTDEFVIEASHKFDDGKIIIEPTCTEVGKKLYTCTVCGRTNIKDIEELGHEIYTETIPPTCTESGCYIKSCSRCGKIVDIETLAPLGHNLILTFDNELHWKICTRCEYNCDKNVHDLLWKVSFKQIDSGYLIKLSNVCEVGCGYVEELTNVFHIHKDTEIIHRTYTCTEDGFSDGLRCAVEGCKNVLFEPVPVPATGHNFKNGECLNWYYDGNIYKQCAADYFDVFQTPGLEYEDLDGYSVVKGIGTAFNEKRIIIASNHNGLPVREIGENAFNSERIESVEVSNNVTSIGGCAFYWCTELENLSLGNNTANIGDGAFENCRSLKNISIPDSLTSIGILAFDQCVNLQFNEYDNAYYLGNAKNKYVVLIKAINTDITSCEINENTKFIYGQYFPNSVGDYFRGAFGGCNKIMSITIPKSVVGIGNGAFDGCYFKNVTAPVWAIKFLNKAQFQNVAITSGEVIENRMFAGCGNLTSLSIPYGVNSIGDSAFYNCGDLTYISIPDTVTKVGEDAFYGCESLKYNEFNNAVYLGNDVNKYVILIKVTDTNITSFEITENTKCLYDRAFENCKSLKSITISSKVTYLPLNAFGGCNNIDSVHYKGNLRGWCELEGLGGLLNKNIIAIKVGNIILTDYNGNLSIPAGTGKISACAFRNCTFKSVIIPNSVTSIGDGAFEGCQNLTSIKIPESVTSIGMCAFGGCYSLSEISIPGTIDEIKDSTFSGCYDLVKVEISDGVKSIGWNAFYVCGYLTEIIIPESVTKIEFTAFNGCSELTNIIFKGTKAQWKVIELGINRDNYTHDLIITCSDGKLDKDGNEVK